MKKKARRFERIEYLGAAAEGAGNLLFDLSSGGAAFLHSQELPAGTKISLKVQDHILDAVVVYTAQRPNGGYRIGAQFLNLSDEMEEILETLVDDFSCGAQVTCNLIGIAQPAPKQP
jgi:hypothetical protein